MAANDKASAEDVAHWRKWLLSLKGLTVVHADGVGTSTGRSDYLQVMGYDTDADCVQDCTRTVYVLLKSSGCSYRWNDKRGMLTVTGYGFSKTHEVAHHLADVLGQRMHYDGSHTADPRRKAV